MGLGIEFEDKELEELLTHFSLPEKAKKSPRLKLPKVIVIAGPTAVGKTAMSIQIAKAIGGQIISADSMQVYRDMNIGTAKATIQERDGVIHHLIDICDIQDPFNISMFHKKACEAIKHILAEGSVPIVVGGTGFYIHALIYGPPSGPPSLPEIRSDLEEEMEKKGSAALYERLKLLDPVYASSITANDKHKIIRGLEIIQISQRKVSDFANKNIENCDKFNFRCWFLYQEKEALYQKIELRCEKMMANGFLEEVKNLLNNGLKNNSSASQAIGYRQCIDYLESKQTAEDWASFLTEFKQASRRYAKRQFTWFRKEPLFRWLSLDQFSFEMALEMIIQDFELSF